jgi:LacI family transcriptional regulator
MSRNSKKLPTVVLAVESSRASGRSLLRGISEYERRHGPWAFYWEPGGFEDVARRLGTVRADGIILRDVEGLDQVRRYDIPAIVIGHSKSEVRGFTNVITDSGTTASLAAEHLIDCGFQSFAFVGYRDNPWSDARRDQFVAHVERAGFKVAVHGAAAGLSRGEEQAALVRWLKTLPAPIGVMGCNDDRAQNVSEACKIAGLRVPDDVGIIGADNDELVCDLSHPPLSSVAINFERAGFESARALHELLSNPDRSRTQNIVVEATHVVPRQSTDILFIDDIAVARAVRFIRQNARKQIAVADVATAAALSRRVLERRFKGVVGRSVLAEMRRVRVAEISRMLVATSHSITEIAAATGFPGVEHFSRYFRQERNMTPVAYRKTHGQQRV